MFSLNKKTPGKDPKTVREREKDTESKDAKEINRSNSLILKKMKTKTPGRGEDKPYESENPGNQKQIFKDICLFVFCFPDASNERGISQYVYIY